MGKGRKVKHNVFRLKRVFTPCFPCFGSMNVTPDDGNPHSTTEKSELNESLGFLQRRYIPMTTESLADPDLFYNAHILQASFNQLHAPSRYAGNQCTSAALYTLAMHTIKNSFQPGTETPWTRSYLKEPSFMIFLGRGWNLLINRDMRVSLFDLPDYVPVFMGDACYVARGTDVMVFGQVACEMDDVASLGDEFPKLYHYFQNVLSHETSVLVTIGDYTVAVAMDADRVWLFDSHSRDNSGMPGESLTGKACLLAFPDVNSLVKHLVSVYGRDQYCARSFTFYNLADNQVDQDGRKAESFDVSAIMETHEHSCHCGYTRDKDSFNKHARRHKAELQPYLMINASTASLPK